MNLTDQFREEVKKEGLGEEDSYVPTYRTNIDIMDYTNGNIDPQTGELEVGFDGGKICTIIGKSGVGKSTLAIQMGTNIIDNYDESQLIHYDFERASDRNRIKTLTGWSSDKIRDKYIHLTSGIYAETFYKGIKSLAKLKIKNREDLEMDTGRKDYEGNPIKVLPPTVVLIDSLATMSPKNIENEEELSGGMSASAIAKVNTQIFKRIPSFLKDANIILLVINHITTKIEIGPFSKTKSEINYLKQDESVPGSYFCQAM